METSRLETDQLIERYILNQMDDDEASEFEAFFLSNQKCLDQLELAQKLYQGLEQLSRVEEQNVSHLNVDNAAANDKSWWVRKVPAWSLAAMLMIAVLPASLLFLEQEEISNRNISIINLELSGTRSSQSTETSINSSDDWIILSFYVDEDIIGTKQASFDFYIGREDGRGELLIVKGVKLKNDTLNVEIGSELLVPGNYNYNISTSIDGVELSSGKLLVLNRRIIE